MKIETKINREHEKFLKSHGGEFLNHAWSSGYDNGEYFIHSKTNIGRLFTSINSGEIMHWWTPGGGNGFSADISESVRAYPKEKSCLNKNRTAVAVEAAKTHSRKKNSKKKAGCAKNVSNISQKTQ